MLFAKTRKIELIRPDFVVSQDMIHSSSGVLANR